MTNEEALRRWNAAAGRWSRWIKPSLFAQMSADPGSEPPPQVVEWVPPAGDVALIIDLTGTWSIALGVALAALGYCPVPMFNTTRGPREFVETQALCSVLKGAAGRLAARSEGPPAFLLDSERNRYPWPARSGYNNCWYVFASDLPSAEALTTAGIRSVRVVCQDDVARDLRDAMSSYKSLERALQRPDSSEIAPFPKDRWRIWRHLAVLDRSGRRNWDGSFGAPTRHG